MATQAQTIANRSNAQLSTGPTSAAGKTKVSLNAVKTGLTGRTVLLPTDDVAAYEALVAEQQAKWQPATSEEQRLVQALVDAEWRLMRIPALEDGIMALAFREFADEFPDIEDPVARGNAIAAHAFLAKRRELNNLSLQEARIRRHREKDTAALEKLLDERRAARQLEVDKAACLYIEAVEQEVHDTWQPHEFGFDFPLIEIARRALEFKPDLYDALDNTTPKNSPQRDRRTPNKARQRR